MNISTRRELLRSYRTQREATMLNPAGEATGRTYIPIPDELREVCRCAHGISGFVSAFATMLQHSPVIVRRGELLVGDYYYLLPGELIEQYPWDKLAPSWAIGAQAVPPSGHTVVNLSHGLTLGWAGLLSEIAGYRTAFADETPEAAYLDVAAQLVALIQHRYRAYGAEATLLAEASPAEEAAEYRSIAERCTRLATEPPQTLHDALQWYLLYATCERATSSGMGSVRLDQVFYLYYLHDRTVGILTDDDALLLIEALFLKEPLFCSIGGITPDGRDASNTLTALVLAAYDAIGGPSNLALRWHPANGTALLSRAADLLARHGTGVPHLVNDEVVIASLIHFGFPRPQARDYCFAGCFWWVVPGKEYPYHDMAAISGMRALLRALESLRGRTTVTMAELWQAYDDRLREAVAELVAAYARIDAYQGTHYPEMIVSLLMDDTLRRGRDVNNGGAAVSMTTIQYVGLANVADSLTALQTRIFDEGALSFDGVLAAMEANFTGHEETLRLLRTAPKYGNGHPVADAMAERVAGHYKDVLAQYRNARGFALRPAFYSWHRHTGEGLSIGATPDGRLAGQPLAHGGNPAHGQATAGLTATILSMCRLGFTDTAGCPIHLHLYGGPSDTCNQAILALTRTAFALGAVHLIVNLVDGKLLQAAIACPGDYADLTIRVTGYSARFVQLDRAYQQEIASRNAF